MLNPYTPYNMISSIDKTNELSKYTHKLHNMEQVDGAGRIGDER